MTLWLFLALLLSPTGGVEAGRTALQEVAKRHDKVQTLSAQYVQKRTTPLMKKPLASEGQLFFRKEPGCLMLRSSKKRGTVIRIDEKKYEIYRPRRKKLERFNIQDQEWSHALFQTFAQRVDELEKYFDIVGSTVTENGLTVVLEPKIKKEKSVRDLSLMVNTEKNLVEGVSYTDASGDKIAIELKDVQIDPELEAKTFDLETADGTQVIVH